MGGTKCVVVVARAGEDLRGDEHRSSAGRRSPNAANSRRRRQSERPRSPRVCAYGPGKAGRRGAFGLRGWVEVVATELPLRNADVAGHADGVNRYAEPGREPNAVPGRRQTSQACADAARCRSKRCIGIGRDGVTDASGVEAGTFSGDAKREALAQRIVRRRRRSAATFAAGLRVGAQPAESTHLRGRVRALGWRPNGFLLVAQKLADRPQVLDPLAHRVDRHHDWHPE
jgi:hypothetical protein